MSYNSSPDPYCYPGTGVLKNIPNLRSQDLLENFEARMTALRAEEVLPAGRFSSTHYRAIHYHLFQDVYAWAGRYRTMRLSKGDSMFCYPEHINDQMTELFTNLKHDKYFSSTNEDEFSSKAAHFLATLNAIHPFREGNGRTQLTFLALLAQNSGHTLKLNRLNPTSFLSAMIASFSGDETSLCAQIRAIL